MQPLGKLPLPKLSSQNPLRPFSPRSARKLKTQGKQSPREVADRVRFTRQRNQASATRLSPSQFEIDRRQEVRKFQTRFMDIYYAVSSIFPGKIDIRSFRSQVFQLEVLMGVTSVIILIIDIQYLAFRFQGYVNRKTQFICTNSLFSKRKSFYTGRTT